MEWLSKRWRSPSEPLSPPLGHPGGVSPGWEVVEYSASAEYAYLRGVLLLGRLQEGV